MTRRNHIVFLINLLQDVNIVRPLAILAVENLDVDILFLTSRRFGVRDATGVWRTELNELAQIIGGQVSEYASEMDAFLVLQKMQGIIVAASESSLSGHADTHDLFRAAPPNFLRVTLQHGFECVGFLHNRDHDRAHGKTIKFAADVIAGWCDASRLTALAASEKAKLFVTGPPLLTDDRPRTAGPRLGGIICENLHSVRMNASGDFKTPFMDVFNQYAASRARSGKHVTLRPHPGGQYVLKNNVPLGPNVEINNTPMYSVDLSRYSFGISAPSSVVIDMVLAGLPVGVWQDAEGVIDVDNYRGLTIVRGVNEWKALANAADKDRDRVLATQEDFIARSRLVADPETVRTRFLSLLSGGTQRIDTVPRPREIKKILFVANSMLPTLQICFYKPLQPLIDRGDLEVHLITEGELRQRFPNDPDDHVPGGVAEAWLKTQIETFAPSLTVFCRYSGPHAQAIMDTTRTCGGGVMYHIDDDLLNVPIEIGEVKHKKHNRPNRLAAVRALLTDADLVYCSNVALKDRVEKQGFDAPVVTGPMHCSGLVLREAKVRPVTRIGYMGFDHAHDLDTILEPLVEILRCHPQVHFELFGSIPKPTALDEFGDRVSVRPPVREYEAFLNEFAALDWDIGICPLALTEFNKVKANNKWVEYTSVGAAVVATRGMAYDECCDDGCGDLALTKEDWFEALDRLCADPALRADRVARAQARVEAEFSPDKLARQVIGKFRQTLDLANARAAAGRT